MSHARGHVERSEIKEGQYPKRFDEPYARLVAKLYAFTETPAKTLAKYPAADHSVAARMARAVAWHLQANTDQALSSMKLLTVEHPNDAF